MIHVSQVNVKMVAEEEEVGWELVGKRVRVLPCREAWLIYLLPNCSRGLN